MDVKFFQLTEKHMSKIMESLRIYIGHRYLN